MVGGLQPPSGEAKTFVPCPELEEPRAGFDAYCLPPTSTATLPRPSCLWLRPTKGEHVWQAFLAQAVKEQRERDASAACSLPSLFDHRLQLAPEPGAAINLVSGVALRFQACDDLNHRPAPTGLCQFKRALDGGYAGDHSLPAIPPKNKR